MNKLLTKIAGTCLGLAMAVGVGVATGAKIKKDVEVKAAGVTDTLVASSFEATSTTYTDFSGVTFSSSAVYAGNNAKTDSGGIQLRSKNSNSGIVTTASGGTLKSISITVESGSNTLDVYGKTTAYSSASDLYNSSTRGTKIGSASSTGTITLTNPSDYTYVGLRSNNGALYLTKIVITWDNGSGGTTYSVTYNANATANVGGTLPSPHTGLADKATQPLSESGPTRWGYTFGGWATSAESTQAVSSVTINGADITVYAIWNADLTVTGAHASVPFSVAQARSHIDAGQNLEANYVAGKISQIDSYNSTYHSITYWISDDGTASNQLEAYSGKGLNSADFTATTDIETGADVVICGTLKKYGSTYEFDKNNYQISYTAPVITVTHNITFVANGGSNSPSPIEVGDGLTFVFPSAGTKANYIFKGWSTDGNSPFYQSGDTSNAVTADATYNAYWQTEGTSADPYTVAEANAAIAANTGLVGAYTSGIVSQVDSFDSTSKGITYHISDDGTTTGQLKIYKGKGLNKADFTAKEDIEVKASVTITGNLKNYNNTYEYDSGNYQIYYAPVTLSSISISGSLTTTSYATDESWSPAGLIVTATYSDNSTEDVTSSSSWSYSPETPAATGTGSGTLTITATFNEKTDSVSPTVTVTSALYSSSTLVVGTNPDTESWVNSARTASVTYDGFTYSASEGGNNGKYYSNNTSWRLYQGDSGTLTISSTINLIHSIAVTYAINNTGILVFDEIQYASGDTILTGDVSSVTFGVGNTTSATNGQVQVQSILVKYSAKPEIDSISISGSLSKSSYATDESWSPAGLTVTLHYLNSAAPDEDVTDEVTWSFDPATPSSTSITSVEMTATFAGAKTLTDSESFNVTVTAAVPAVEDGEQYILAYPASNYYFTGIVTSGSSKVGEATTYVAFPKTDCAITASDNGDSTFSFEATNGKYLKWSSGNTLDEEDTISDNSKWTVSKNTDGSVSIINYADDTRYLQFNNNSGQQRFATYTNTNHNPYLIKIGDHALAGNFVECFMHPEIPHNPLDLDTGACKDSGEGYYTAAHDAYLLLDSTVKSEFASSSDFANYSARLSAWASANGTTFNPTTGTFTPNSAALLNSFASYNGGTTTSAIIIVSLVSLTALGGYFFIKKKKEQ